MILKILTTERVITGSIGAFAALILKAVYDWFFEYRRREELRNIVIHDLELQAEGFLNLVKDYEKVLQDITNEPLILEPLAEDDIAKVNTNIFKAHSYSDYYKILNEQEYKDLLLMYQIIEVASKETYKSQINEYEASREKLNKSSNTDSNFNDMHLTYFSKILNSKINYYKGVWILLNKYIQDLKQEYHPL